MQTSTRIIPLRKSATTLKCQSACSIADNLVERAGVQEDVRAEELLSERRQEYAAPSTVRRRWASTQFHPSST